MPPKLPRVSGDEVVRALLRLGFTRVRQRGSHVTLQKTYDDGVAGCVVPLHSEVAVGTLKNILRQARVTPEEFLTHL